MRQFFVSPRSVRSIGVRIGVLGTVVAAGLTVAIGHAQAPPPQGVFHTGATAGTIRDVAKVTDTGTNTSTIYAVGTWVNPSTNKLDGALWTFDGTNAPTRTVLPDIASGGANLSAGDAIAQKDGYLYIATQARASTPTTAARVMRDLGGLLTPLNLTPVTTFPTTNYAGNGRLARAISDTGNLLYGQVGRWFGLFSNPADSTGSPCTGASCTNKIFQPRVMRFDVSAGTATEIFPQAATNAGGYVTFQSMQPRAISSDGSVAVGSTSTNAPWTDQQAFRYVHGTGSTAVSTLPGGTWNAPVALTDDGKVVLAIGPSTAFPNREVYLANYASGSEVLTPLGSPNEPWGFNGAGGITADGSVVAITSTTGCAPNICRSGYFHNSNGWFQLTSAMAAAGMNLTGWEDFQIQGISADGMLVWGSGLHNNAEEGYVAEFPTDFLKNFDVVATAPADNSIVGVWAADGTGTPDPSNPQGVVAFMADGAYYQIQATGFERGSYEFDGSFVKPTTRLDTNGDEGLSDDNGSAVSVSVIGNELRSPANCTFDALHADDCFVATRIVDGPGSIVGGWAMGDATKGDSSAVIVFTAGNRYFMAQDGNSVAEPGGRDGVEIGTYSWDGTHLVATTITTDTNGEWGLSDPIGQIRLQLSADELSAIGGDDTGTFVFARILIVTAATPTGTSVVVAPTDPSGNQSISLTFDTVTTGGETTVQTVDPVAVESAVTPPAGFTLGDPPVYYEISTTAEFTGPVTLCFNYGGINFPSGTPRLYHYESGAWVDITTSLDMATQTICGSTMSFSPFAIFVSPITRSGFHAPVSSVAGFVNTVKGGSTVPLKFNIQVNGVEKTDTGGLEFSVAAVNCTTAAEDPVEAVTSGSTSLRYDATSGQFIQNWKTPKSAGCYVARITTTADGLSISAFFKTK